ncbi:hypothetical protein C350_06675 [Cryptococcus neoformans MW-RSA36]|nr:hypothetical protein C350_06675 [Cryptococcus neoformans var. grubii MW-RSA36]
MRNDNIPGQENKREDKTPIRQPRTALKGLFHEDGKKEESL